jgi:hypothetical protein
MNKRKKMRKRVVPNIPKYTHSRIPFTALSCGVTVVF